MNFLTDSFTQANCGNMVSNKSLWTTLVELHFTVVMIAITNAGYPTNSDKVRGWIYNPTVVMTRTLFMEYWMDSKGN